MTQIRANRPVRSARIRVQDVHGMALRLVARHGSAATEVAAFSRAEHEIRGDRVRMAAWHAVESTVADMLSRRLSTDAITVH